MQFSIPPDILASAVGSEHVLRDADRVLGYAADWTGRHHGDPLAVVRPGTAEEVGAVLRACAEHGQGVVIQGGNTGLAGGAAPRNGDVVLSTERFVAIEAVDAVAGHVVVGAGVTLADLQRALAPHGLELPVDLGAREQATVGGMAATGAGGARAFRHGTMRAHVAGIEAVLADGSIVERLGGVLKDATGYSWPALLSGSEGTLGVITRLRLRVRPIAPSRAVAMVAVADLDAALALAVGLRDALPGLEAAEFMLSGATALVTDVLGFASPVRLADGEVLLLVELRAARDALEELAEALEGVADALGDTALADGSESERLWRHREGIGEALARRAPVVKLDVSLPLDRLAEGVAAIEDAVARTAPHARPHLFGHLLDGNVHVNSSGVAEGETHAVEDAVLGAVVAHGGSIGAEHGIGRAKTRWLSRDRSPADIAAMRAVKAALDPAGVLGAGVLFEA
jgi:FAD/FMN-containing dehydrogenase